MSSAGDYTVLRNILAEYSFLGNQAWTTSQPIVVTNTTATTVLGTGALVVQGGASISGNISLGGTISGPNFPSISKGFSTFGGVGTNQVIHPIGPYVDTNYSVFLAYKAPIGTGNITTALAYSTLSVSSFVVTLAQTGSVYSWATMGQQVLS
jgi:hypothetical protein